MKYSKLHFLSILALMAVSPCIATAQTGPIIIGNTIDSRISGDLDLLPTGGSNGAENGGLDSNLIGLNSNNVENWSLIGFDLTAAAGSRAVSATIAVNVAGLTSAQHGDTGDFFTIHQLHAGNAGWLQGNDRIATPGADLPAGGVTFQNRADSGLGTDVNPDVDDIPWVDANGANLSNFLGAFDSTPLNTNTVIGWNTPSDAPDEIVFNLDAATAQAWIDAGSVPGIVLTVNDGGDNQSRFNFADGANSFRFTIFVATGPDFLLGDVNMDGAVNFLDISPFISLLATSTFQAEADANADGAVSFFDIAPFIAILSSPQP